MIEKLELTLTIITEGWLRHILFLLHSYSILLIPVFPTMTQPERPRTILTPQHDGDTDEDTQQGEGDGQLEQSTEQQPSLPNHHGCAHPARAWLRRYAVPLASSLAGMCVALIALESRGRRGRRKQLPLRQGHTVTG